MNPDSPEVSRQEAALQRWARENTASTPPPTQGKLAQTAIEATPDEPHPHTTEFSD